MTQDKYDSTILNKKETSVKGNNLYRFTELLYRQIRPLRLLAHLEISTAKTSFSTF